MIISFLGFKYTKVGTLEIWEVGGQANIRSIWRQHLQYVSYLIWVVDASNFARIQESKTELHKILKEPGLQDVKILVYANRFSDTSFFDAESIGTLSNLISKSNDLQADHLNLHKLNQPWFVQSCSAREALTKATEKALVNGINFLLDTEFDTRKELLENRGSTKTQKNFWTFVCCGRRAAEYVLL